MLHNHPQFPNPQQQTKKLAWLYCTLEYIKLNVLLSVTIENIN